MSRRILLLGGAGFIGRHLCTALVGEGHTVTVVTKNSATLPGAKVLRADVFDFASYREEFSEADVVCNLIGARTGTAELIERMNYDFSRMLLERLKAGKQTIVHFGTRLQYGKQQLPVNEDVTCTPTDPYGAAKLRAERLHFDYAKRFGSRCICLRISNVYGPQGSGFLHRMIETLSADGTYVVEGGSTIKDLLYIDDCVSAILACLSSEKSIGEVINVGSGEGKSLREIAEIVHQAIGTGSLVPGTKESADVSFCADITKIKRLTGWTPRMRVEEGVLRTVR